VELKHKKAEKSNGHSYSGISPPLHRFFRPQTAEARQTAARGRGGVRVGVVVCAWAWWCAGGRGVEFRSSEDLARLLQTHRRCPDGRAWPWP